MSYILDLAKNAKAAQYDIANASQAKKSQMLNAISEALLNNIDIIIEKNKIDLENATENGISETMIDRLMLNESRIRAISNGVLKVNALPDPIGEVIDGKLLPSGLSMVKKRVPLGVIGIIYESRPNVTVDAAVLCLKASNVVILRGGKEAINSNILLSNLMRDAIEKCGLNPNILSLVSDTSRDCATQMMKLNGYIDVLIPRGGSGLIQAVVQNATVPVIETGIGNCHIYVDNEADLQMGANIVYNAKVSRPSVCNACENLLVHKDIAAEFLPMANKLLSQKNVELVGCKKTIDILGDSVKIATDEDYSTEFLDFKLAIRVVESLNDAIAHIQKYTSNHSEAIITNSFKNADIFTSQVDAAAVYVNASTRFTDGEEFGLGAEIGISTQKLHTRGPMGLRELTSVKYILTGNGNIR